MAGANRIQSGHDIQYEAVTAAVEGGVVVVPANGATNAGVQGIVAAGDAALNVVGVTARRAEPVNLQNLVGTDGDGYPIVYPNVVNELTAVYKQAVVKVTYTAVAVAYGVKLSAAANGQVRAWVSGDGAAAIIGFCAAVGGVPGAGGSYPMFIN